MEVSTQLTELIARYFAAWNERDTARRQELIAQTWTEDATYCDPLVEAKTREGIHAMIGNVQGQFPGLIFRQKGGIDVHHAYVRFAWELGAVDGPVVAAGTDIGTLVDNRLDSVIGFLDLG